MAVRANTGQSSYYVSKVGQRWIQMTGLKQKWVATLAHRWTGIGWVGLHRVYVVHRKDATLTYQWMSQNVQEWKRRHLSGNVTEYYIILYYIILYYIILYYIILYYIILYYIILYYIILYYIILYYIILYHIILYYIILYYIILYYIILYLVILYLVILYMISIILLLNYFVCSF